MSAKTREQKFKKIEMMSINEWLVSHGQHPDEVVNGESLFDLLWCFYVHLEDERNTK
jgi:hypothetical protein